MGLSFEARSQSNLFFIFVPLFQKVITWLWYPENSQQTYFLKYFN